MNPLRRHVLTLAGALALRPRFVLAEPARLTVSGSSTLAPLLTELARQYRLNHPDLAIEVRAGGSQVGLREAREGRVDIGMVSRALHADEKDLFVFTVARDGVALVVHRDNPVGEISRTRTIELLTGRLANWRQLGGADAPIVVISRPPGYSSLEVVSHYFGLGPGDIKAAALAADNAESLRAAATQSNCFCFFSVGLAEREAERGAPIKALALDGVPATSAMVRSGRYPLARPLNLVTRNLPTGAARAFIEFALSPIASKTIEQYDFVPFLS